MRLFDSIFGIDILGNGKPDFLDDAVILAALEEEDVEQRCIDAYSEEDEAIESGAADEHFDY